MSPYLLYLAVLGVRRFSYATGYTLFAVYMLRVVQTNPLELVMPGVVYELAIFLFEVPTGVVADVYSRRLSVIIGYALMGIGFIVAGVLPSLLVACAGLAIAGIGSTFVSGALSAWLVDEVGQEQASQAFMRGAQLNAVASLIGIGLSMILGTINLQLAVMGAGVPLLITSIILLFIMPETRFQPALSSDRRHLFTTFGQGLKFVRASRIVLTILLVTLVLAGFGETFGKLWQAHILERFTLPALGNADDILWFGIIGAVAIPGSLLATEIVRKQVDLASGPAVASALSRLFIALTASALLFALSNNFALALLGIWSLRIVMAMIGPLMQIWLNQHVAAHVRATVLSMAGQVNSFGEIVVGGPLAGGIATLLSVRVVIVLVALSLLPLNRVFRHRVALSSGIC